MILLEKLAINIPDSYEEMSEEELRSTYPGIPVTKAFIQRDSNSVICLAASDQKLLKSDVKKRLNEYYTLYLRMVPGFKIGEMLIRRETLFNFGIMTYASHAMESDRFNILGLMNLDEKEILIQFNCNMKDSLEKMAEYRAIIDSVTIAG